MMKRLGSDRRGFTLIELLIVIAIISLLASLMIPAVQHSREAARRTQCANNMRQFGLAFANHESADGRFPSGIKVWVKGPIVGDAEWAFHGFMPDLLPYLEQTAVADRYDQRKMFSAAENAQAIGTVLDVALCPSTPRDSLHFEGQMVPSVMFAGADEPTSSKAIEKMDEKYAGPYRAAVFDYTGIGEVHHTVARQIGLTEDEMQSHGLDGMFPSAAHDEKEFLPLLAPVLLTSAEAVIGRGLAPAQIEDGLSHTLMLVEVAGRPRHYVAGKRDSGFEPLHSGWANPQTIMQITGDADCLVNCDNKESLYSFHDGTLNLLFADGHVSTVMEGADGKTVIAWITPNQGDQP